ncbi:pyridoxamine 5'-phosphate oxidase family protein [Streptomyces canus]|uniref:pyridoxamine 5'-phosphate oxidase family protein n=1 Tax=Streptomyces canus TaxID=58343 RepID=UPI00371A5418
MNWAAFTSAEPDLAKTVEERFGAFTHHVLATLRKDGSPRTTGLEVRFLHGELWLGMMPDSLKARDLHRDPRFCLQANPGEGQSLGGGDVRISGHAREITDPGTKAAYGEEVKPPEPFHLFRTELTEVVRTSVEDEKYLVLQVWKPGQPLRTIKRT